MPLTVENIELLAKELNITTEMGKQALVVALENVKLWDKKQQDYGSRNISDFGLSGIKVRLNDKLQRLIHLLKNSESNREIFVLVERDKQGYIAKCPSIGGVYEEGTTKEEAFGNACLSAHAIIEAQCEPNNETLYDTLLDISNYGLIGQMLIKGIWK